MATIYTQAGEEVVVDAIEAQTACYVGWGTGVGTAAKADTALFTEAAETRIVGTETQPLADKNQWVALLTCNATPKTITNAGLFDAVSAGNLVIHGDFTGIALAAGDKIEFTITLEQT